MTMLSKSTNETKKIAEDFLKNLSPRKNKATVVGLYGELGSGKTTFAQFVAKELDIDENVQSPTFVIMKSYPIKLSTFNFQLLTHIDAYRLNSREEIEKLGWEEIASNPENLILVEWPEKIKGAMPMDEIKIDFTFIDDNTREIEINY